jgi:phosphate transport system ATP-binding protein
MPDKIIVRHLRAFFHKVEALHDVNVNFSENRVTAIIGPSGCGKSTLVRCLNRMHEVVPGATCTGEVMLDGEDIYASAVDPVQVRRRVGMVFQKPTPFPTMSIQDNVAAGLKLNGIALSRSDRDRIVEQSLKRSALWEEVKDRLARPGASLSGGQQQRLCVARALAVEESYTIVIVTHNMQQAARCSDYTAFLYAGDLIEFGETRQIFTTPTRRETEDYITGRFG